MKPIVIAVLSVAALGLTACATPTPYAPADLTSRSSYQPGFKETRLESNRYRIGFTGNTQTRRDTVETYLLYRAAEVTLENGYDWFEVVNSGVDETRRRTTVGPDPYLTPFSWRFSYGRRWGPWGYYGMFEPDYIEYSRYEATAEVILYRGEKPDNNPRAYNAREIRGNLEGRIVRPAPQ